MKWRLLSLVVVLWLTWPAGISLADEAPPAARAAAEKGMKMFLRPDALGSLHYFGLQSTDDLKKAKVGEGFEWSTIDPEKILQNPPPEDLHDLIEPTRTWMFLIVVNDLPKARLEVSRNGDKWEASGLAEAGLPMALRDISRKWPKNQGYRVRYVNIMQLPSFVEVTRNNRVTGVFVSPSFASYLKLKAPSDLTFIEVDHLRVLPAIREMLKRRRGGVIL